MYKDEKINCDPLVSIILPIYNANLYLSKCIESVLQQTYKNLEVICIDDGSTDGSEVILDRYSAMDSRIRAIRKKNGGESSARNAGLKVMSGQYVAFLDCDDWIEPDMYERLVSYAIEKKVDMVVSTWFCDRENISKKISNLLPISKEVFGRKQLLNYIYRRDDYRGFAYMWDKLYRRELFYDSEGNLMLFDEDLTLGGDVLYLGKLALNTKSSFYIDEAFYHYNQREISGCHTKDLKKHEDWIEAYRRLISYLEKAGIKEDMILWIKRFMAYHSSNAAELAYEQGNQDVLIRCQGIMNQYKSEYISTNQQYPDRIERYNKILMFKE